MRLYYYIQLAYRGQKIFFNLWDLNPRTLGHESSAVKTKTGTNVIKLHISVVRKTENRMLNVRKIKYRSTEKKYEITEKISVTCHWVH